MRVLLDENLPHDLAAALTGHPVSTVQGLGWAGIKNGALLKRAGDVCDVFITMAANIERQQNLANLSFGVVVIDRHGWKSERLANRLEVEHDADRDAVHTRQLRRTRYRSPDLC